MKFTLNIDSNNEAMMDRPTYEVMLPIFDYIVGSLAAGDKQGPVFDVNGNTVGYWQLGPNLCNEFGAKGTYTCTRPKGHEGDHIQWIAHASWENKS